MSAQQASPTWLDEPTGVHPESDLANAHRIRYHCSDRLRWVGSGWQAYARGTWRDGEAGALALASQLYTWIADEVASLESVGPKGAAAARLAWSVESQSCSRIEAALKLAKGLMETAGEVASGSVEVSGSQSHREQCLAAMLAVLNAGDDGLRSSSSGRLIAAKLCERVEQMAPKYWQGLGEPPLARETLERMASAAFSGDITAGARRRGKEFIRASSVG